MSDALFGDPRSGGLITAALEAALAVATISPVHGALVASTRALAAVLDADAGAGVGLYREYRVALTTLGLTPQPTTPGGPDDREDEPDALQQFRARRLNYAAPMDTTAS